MAICESSKRLSIRCHRPSSGCDTLSDVPRDTVKMLQSQRQAGGHAASGAWARRSPRGSASGRRSGELPNSVIETGAVDLRSIFGNIGCISIFDTCIGLSTRHASTGQMLNEYHGRQPDDFIARWWGPRFFTPSSKPPASFSISYIYQQLDYLAWPLRIYVGRWKAKRVRVHSRLDDCRCMQLTLASSCHLNLGQPFRPLRLDMDCGCSRSHGWLKARTTHTLNCFELVQSPDWVLRT